MNIRSALIANPQPAKLMQPRQSTFNDPASFTQPATVSCSSSGQHRYDLKKSQNLSMGLGVISAVTLHTVRLATWASSFACYLWDSLYKWQQLGNVMAIGTGQFHRKRDTVGIGNEVMFRAQFPSIRWIRPRFRPPKTARTDAESATAREKSSMSACRNLFSSRPCILSHTPAFCQSLSRRQQVIPLPQPISFGRCSQGMPVLRTNRIPVKVARSEIGFRPGYRNLLLFFGISGSMSFHNSSSNIGFAMSNLLVTGFRLLMLSVIPVNILSFC